MRFKPTRVATECSAGWGRIPWRAAVVSAVNLVRNNLPIFFTDKQNCGIVLSSLDERRSHTRPTESGRFRLAWANRWDKAEETGIVRRPQA
jgi:hypothetical protein